MRKKLKIIFLILAVLLFSLIFLYLNVKIYQRDRQIRRTKYNIEKMKAEKDNIDLKISKELIPSKIIPKLKMKNFNFPSREQIKYIDKIGSD